MYMMQIHQNEWSNSKERQDSLCLLYSITFFLIMTTTNGQLLEMTMANKNAENLLKPAQAAYRHKNIIKTNY